MSQGGAIMLLRTTEKTDLTSALSMALVRWAQALTTQRSGRHPGELTAWMQTLA
ncbi:hypothetical protein [Rhodococcus sp. 5G237]